MDCGAWICFFVSDFLQRLVSPSQILTENDILEISNSFDIPPKETKALEMRTFIAHELDE